MNLVTKLTLALLPLVVSAQTALDVKVGRVPFQQLKAVGLPIVHSSDGLQVLIKSTRPSTASFTIKLVYRHQGADVELEGSATRDSRDYYTMVQFLVPSMDVPIVRLTVVEQSKPRITEVPVESL